MSQIQDLSVSFVDVILELIAKVTDPEIIAKINNSISGENAKTYLGRHQIMNLLKESTKL